MNLDKVNRYCSRYAVIFRSKLKKLMETSAENLVRRVAFGLTQPEVS